MFSHDLGRFYLFAAPPKNAPETTAGLKRMIAGR
jgi:hypothetical protein